VDSNKLLERISKVAKLLEHNRQCRDLIQIWLIN